MASDRDLFAISMLVCTFGFVAFLLTLRAVLLHYDQKSKEKIDESKHADKKVQN